MENTEVTVAYVSDEGSWQTENLNDFK